jgi:methylenetetrahydrofolate--tRNA-(uracil-5-)-methyltransferase
MAIGSMQVMLAFPSALMIFPRYLRLVMEQARVIGAGLAGCEAALQLASFGVQVKLFEMKPDKKTPAQKLDGIAELVCSNSFRSNKPTNAVGLLKDEMLMLNGFLMKMALLAKVPAGDSLAVDRKIFSKLVEEAIKQEPNITLVKEEIKNLPIDEIPTILATGPLTSDDLAKNIASFIGQGSLAFYDAIAPIIEADSIDMEHAFIRSRWQKDDDEGDYVNCPMDKLTYERFVKALVDSSCFKAHDFEDAHYFEGCLPLEVMAERGIDTLRFGPLKPIGLINPKNSIKPHAVLQLRKEDKYGTSYNLVGCQTRMTIAWQKQVFSMVPALKKAKFMRFGSIHRNTYLDGPQVLDKSLCLKNKSGQASNIFVAGQISGVEGYVESIAVGLMVAHFIAQKLLLKSFIGLPPESALGGLYGHVCGLHRRKATDPYTPSNVTWAMIPPIIYEKRLKRLEKRQGLYERAISSIKKYREELVNSFAQKSIKSFPDEQRL